MKVEEWMVEAATYYRRHDFFAAAGTEAWMLEDLLRVYEARHGRFHPALPIGGRWPDKEIDLLALDEDRVVYLDFETDSTGGSTMYVSTIPKIARITRGVFSAWDINETGP